jgi:hypothetical protein
MKKIISVLLAVIICAAVCVPAFADLVLPPERPDYKSATVVNENGAATDSPDMILPYGTEVQVTGVAETDEDGNVTALKVKYNGSTYIVAVSDLSGPGVNYYTAEIEDGLGQLKRLAYQLFNNVRYGLLNLAYKLGMFFSNIFSK